MNAARCRAPLPEAGATQERTLKDVGCSDQARGDYGLSRLDPLKPLFECLRYCHVPHRDEPFVTQGSIKAHPSTQHQHEGLDLARKRRVGGGDIGSGSYVGVVTFHHNIPLTAERSCERKPIPDWGG